jgi:hypothetical protein
MARSATHETFERGEVKPSSERSFGVVFAGASGVIGCWPLIGGHYPRAWAVTLAVLFLAAAFLRPALLKPLNLLWFKLGLLLHRLASPIGMAAIFLIGVVPTGFMMRCRGKDPLRIRPPKKGETNWVIRDGSASSPDSLKRLF